MEREETQIKRINADQIGENAQNLCSLAVSFGASNAVLYAGRCCQSICRERGVKRSSHE